MQDDFAIAVNLVQELCSQGYSLQHIMRERGLVSATTCVPMEWIVGAVKREQRRRDRYAAERARSVTPGRILTAFEHKRGYVSPEGLRPVPSL